MKNLFLLLFLAIGFQLSGQMIMSAEGVSPDNACNPNEIYFLFERKPRPVEPKDTIEVRLNNSISISSDSKNIEFSIQCVINCNGELGGGFHTVNSSGNEDLEEAVTDFLKTITEWHPGRKNKRKTVDSWYMWRFELSEGILKIK
jgi:hypothetical protein